MSKDRAILNAIKELGEFIRGTNDIISALETVMPQSQREQLLGTLKARYLELDKPDRYSKVGELYHMHIDLLEDDSPDQKPVRPTLSVIEGGLSEDDPNTSDDDSK